MVTLVNLKVGDLDWAWMGSLGSGPLPMCLSWGPDSWDSGHLKEALPKVVAGA